MVNPSITAVVLAFLVGLSSLLVLELKLAIAVRSVENKLRQVDVKLSEYRTFEKYMKRRDRDVQATQLASAQKSLEFVSKHQMFLGSRSKALIETDSRRANELRSFIREFIPEYTKRETERHRDFFEARPFDRDQIEAIVKKDEYNLVIAAAGSGKTRTLTARIAFMIRCGASPEEILALAYTNEAEDEMRRRLESEYGIANANVRTFHSLGRKLAEQSPNFRPGVATNERQREFIADSTKRLRSNREFAMHLVNYALESRVREQKSSDFTDPEKYYEYLRNQKYTTLAGKQVKSIAERDIANFFFMNSVRFEYESPARWADRSKTFRQYQPDFFLPEYGVWIEHWAVNRQGKVPAWFSHGQETDASARYRAEMKWKRSQFKKHRRKLIETYSYQWVEGTLIPDLKRQLDENRVALRELTMEEILSHIEQLMPRTEPLHELMFSFISKAKTNGLSVDDVSSRIAHGTWNRKQRAFGSMMISVWHEYEMILKQKDMIDFNDMINYALQVARQNGGQLDRYSHILIDEFQDITDAQLELIGCLLQNGDDATLFCVGDDMQNIFSFAGSNVSNILHFEALFPHAEQTILSTNYRCPSNIVDASNSIANMNKARIQKSVVAACKIQSPIRLIEMQSDEEKNYEEWEFQTAKGLLEQLIDSRRRGEEIMVLARYNRPLTRLKMEFPRHEDLGLRFLSIHRAKATEADYVLILGCVSGQDGFPSWLIDQELLDIVKKTQSDEADRLEEERCLFYVGLTRCRNQLFLFTSRSSKSQFVSELNPYLSLK